MSFLLGMPIFRAMLNFRGVNRLIGQHVYFYFVAFVSKTNAQVLNRHSFPQKKMG